MKRINKVCEENLVIKLNIIDSLLESARNCLINDDFVQCSVRINEIRNEAKITDFEMKIYESIS